MSLPAQALVESLNCGQRPDLTPHVSSWEHSQADGGHATLEVAAKEVTRNVRNEMSPSLEGVSSSWWPERVDSHLISLPVPSLSPSHSPVGAPARVQSSCLSRCTAPSRIQQVASEHLLAARPQQGCGRGSKCSIVAAGNFTVVIHSQQKCTNPVPKPGSLLVNLSKF